MSNNKDIENLLKNIQEGLKNYSIKELNEGLVSFLNKKHDKKEEIDYVIDLVTRKFDISERTLKKTNARGSIQDAKQITYCLLYFNLGLPIRYISKKIFFNWPTSVLVGIKRYKNANTAIKDDKVFVDSYLELQIKLVEFITNKKQKNESIY
jgi:hypothetical protein